MLLAPLLAVAFRWPLAVQGAAGYLTPDGALSGIVALRLRDAASRLVFVPQVAYSGSLKSHLTAPLAALIDPARAFAMVSVLFYGLFVAALVRLALAMTGPGERVGEGRALWTAAAAGLYAAFAPAFVTRYSLSNDGNYVEVLALGTCAMVLALRWRRQPDSAAALAWLMGVLLGLAFWSHVLALVYVLAIGLWMAAADVRRALRALPRLLGGFALAFLPALLWNAGHGWDTFRYLVPGGEGLQGGGVSTWTRLREVLGVQWAVLLGYDPGNVPVVDALLRVLAGGAAAAVLLGLALEARARLSRRLAGEPAAAETGGDAVSLLLILTAVTVALALFALPVVPGNPRYLLFAMSAVPILIARTLASGGWRWTMAALVAGGALASLSQAPGAFHSDRQWRGFVGAIEREGVRYCHTDFYLATKINFLSQERVVCSAKLGPTTTEYFFDYRYRAERAPEAALVAVNESHAEKLERRLQRLGVGYQRLHLMKPVLLRLSRKVDPEELFPDRQFPLR